MREKEYSEWMSKQGFDALRHANCCKIAFNGGWESRQIEMDKLQTKFDQHDQWLGQRNRYVQELNDIIAKHVAEKDELQKKNKELVHALIKANEKSSHWAGEYWKGVERSAEYQAILLTSDNDLEVDCFKKEKEIERLRKQVYELEQALKGGSDE